MSPHLFTHLFYEGVIVSTRKLVYDASASEDAIKSLMQAQHKAVLKDLKIHTFDDKIDAYLGSTPGLEPRASVGRGPRVSDPEISIEHEAEAEADPAVARASTEPSGPPTEQLELQAPEPAPVPRAKRKSTVPPPKQSIPTTQPEGLEPSRPRTKTAERTSRGSQFRSISPPAPPEDSTPEALQAGLTVPTPSRVPTPHAHPRAATPPPIPQRVGASKTAITLDSSPEIEIISHENRDTESGRTRGPRDTAVDNSYEDAIPSAILPDATIPSDGIPPRAPEARPNSASRPPGAAQGAALLPAMRQPSRPAITPPSVVSRPLPPDPNRVGRGDSEAIEIYAPAPPSVEPPPGERTERPGQYSMNRRREIATQDNVPLRDHTGRVAVPAGLARPRPSNQSGASPVVRTPSSSSSSIQTPPGRLTPPSQSDGVVRHSTHPPSDGVPQPHEARPVPPARPPHVTAPISSRTNTGNAPSSGNVITTRPAVIVGAPPRPPGTPNPQRVRKAREDEGRGFGQGLISEKSLDEVILAYLSEDADEK